MLKAEGAAGTYMSCERDRATNGGERAAKISRDAADLLEKPLLSRPVKVPIPTASCHRCPGPHSFWCGRFLGVELVHLSLCSSSDVGVMMNPLPTSSVEASAVGPRPNKDAVRPRPRLWSVRGHGLPSIVPSVPGCGPSEATGLPSPRQVSQRA